MGNKMLMAHEKGCQVYFETNDGENIYLEIDEPEFFEAGNCYVKVQIPLVEWNIVVDEYQKRYYRHLDREANNNIRQMELDL